MSHEIYAVRIEDGKMSGDIFPLYLDVSSPRMLSGVSYARLTRTPVSSNKNDKDFFASIPVIHPDTITVDETNWAAFVYILLHHGNPDGLIYKSDNVALRGYSTLSRRITFGPYFFLMSKPDATYGILVLRSPDSKEIARKLSDVTFLMNFWRGMITHKSTIEYNQKRIIVRLSASEIDMNFDKAYSAWFKQELTPEQCLKIYIEKITVNSFTLDLFDPEHNQADPEKTIVMKSRFGFKYFESTDGTLRFTLHNDAVEQALRSVSLFIDDLNKMKFLSAQGIKMHYDRVVKTLVEKGVDNKEARQETINACIHIHDMYQLKAQS